MSVPTPHISAKLGDFAKTVLMPGDPLRSEFIAKNFLKSFMMMHSLQAAKNMPSFSCLHSVR